MKIEKKTLLYEKVNEHIVILNDIYEKDRYHARVYFMNNSNQNMTHSREDNFKARRLYKFEDAKGNIDLVMFTQSYGISKVNKRYISKKVDFRIRIRPSGVWVTYQNKIRAFMPFDSVLQQYYGEVADAINGVMYEKLAWYRCLSEEMRFFDKSLNYYINNKLYNMKDTIKHMYGFDWPLSKLLYGLDKKGSLYGGSDFRNLKYYKDWISNENKFNEELILNNWRLFHDSLRIAKIVDKKVNLRWSKARLEKEHIDMSMTMVEIVYQYDESELDNKSCYKEFAEFSGYKLLSTAKELATEGITKRHCVVSYKGSVDSHRCAIYSVGDYTLELIERDKGLHIAQFRGHENKGAPDKLENEVYALLDKFNNDTYVHIKTSKPSYEEVMPF